MFDVVEYVRTNMYYQLDFVVLPFALSNPGYTLYLRSIGILNSLCNNILTSHVGSNRHRKCWGDAELKQFKTALSDNAHVLKDPAGRSYVLVEI